MPRALRFSLYGFAAAAVLVAAVAAYFLLTFDAKRYTPRLIEIVREKTGRTLTIAGDIKLSLGTGIAIDTGPLKLSERDGQTLFASIDSARLRMELKPLLSREVVVDGIDIRGADVRIVRDHEGRLNIDDLLGREGPPAAFDIGRLSVADSRVAYFDLASGDSYVVHDINGETGRLTKRVPTTVRTTFAVSKAGAPWRVTASLESGLVLDPDDERTTLKQTTLAGESVLSVETVRFTVTLGSASYARGNLALEEVGADATMKGAAGTTALKVGAPRFERAADAYRAPWISFALDLARGATLVRANATAALEGNLKSGRIALDALDGRIAAEGPRLPNRALSASARGSAAVDLHRPGMTLRLNGAIGDSTVAAEIDAAGFASPVYTFRVNVDKLDLDRYSDTRAQRAGKGESLLQPLADLPATGSLHIGALRSGDTQMKDVTLVLK